MREEGVVGPLMAGRQTGGGGSGCGNWPDMTDCDGGRAGGAGGGKRARSGPATMALVRLGLDGCMSRAPMLFTKSG